MLNVCFTFVSLSILIPVHLFAEVITPLRDGEIPCENDWFYFGQKCYKTFGGNMKPYGRVSWTEATKRCENHGGHLATIDSEELQEFLLVFQLLTADMETWIGLNDREKEGEYKWADGTAYNYSNWKPKEPSGDRNDNCVKMLLQTDLGEPGNWKDFDCNAELAYICQVDKGKQMRIAKDPTLCSSGGWRYESSCYNIVKERMTWENAEKHCQEKFKGHLLTILNFKMNYFLKLIMTDSSEDIWIGIKMKDQVQQEFSSGWPAVRAQWGPNPSIFVDNTCVVRTKEKTYEVVSCSQTHYFVCEVSDVPRPVLKDPFEDSKCPVPEADWWDVGGEFCYYMDTTMYNWRRANFECLRRGGSLATFHSKEEIAALAPYVKDALLRSYSLFIGPFRSQAHENIFLWPDGSQMEYQNWFEDAPNNKDEKCGELFATNMKWNDVKCDEAKAYMCSAKKVYTKLKPIKDSHCLTMKTFKIVTGVSAGIILLVIVLTVMMCLLRPRKVDIRKKSSIGTVPIDSPIPPILEQIFMIDRLTGNVIVNDSEGAYEYID